MQVSNFLDSIFQRMPIILGSVMISFFVIVGVVQYKFHSEIFAAGLPEIAVFISIVTPVGIQVCRCVTGLFSAGLFKRGNYVFGAVALLCSLWLTMFEHGEVLAMSEVWNGATVLGPQSAVLPHLERKIEISKTAFVAVMRLLVWASFVIEIFLAVWLSMDKAETPKKQNARSNGQSKSNGAYIVAN